jgi:hypothetical protein
MPHEGNYANLEYGGGRCAGRKELRPTQSSPVPLQSTRLGIFPVNAAIPPATMTAIAYARRQLIWRAQCP